jgi:hypothetical protein
VRTHKGFAGKVLRPLAVIASVTMLTLVFAGTALAATVDWAGNGWPVNEDCENSAPGEMLWIYTGDSDSTVVLTVNGVTYDGVQMGQGSWHIVTPFFTDKPTASVEYSGDYDAGVLTLSHGCPGESEETPAPTPEETPVETPVETPEETPAQATPAETPEGSVAGGTGTPAPSQPDTAMGVQGGPSPIPTIAFALILVAALGTLAWANVKAARSRA